MKYYIGDINEKNGGMEYSSTILFTAQKGEDPDCVIDNILRTWRGWCSEDGVAELEDNYGEEGLWSDDSFMSVGGYEEISKEVFKACHSTGYLPDLTNMHIDYVEATQPKKEGVK